MVPFRSYVNSIEEHYHFEIMDYSFSLWKC